MDDWVRGKSMTPHPTERVDPLVMPSPTRGEGTLTNAHACGAVRLFGLLFLLLHSLRRSVVHRFQPHAVRIVEEYRVVLIVAVVAVGRIGDRQAVLLQKRAERVDRFAALQLERIV